MSAHTNVIDNINVSYNSEYMVSVRLMDHSMLGGRMGTERVSIIKEYLFDGRDHKKIRTMVELLCKRIGLSEKATSDFLDKQAHPSKTIDGGAYGVEVRCYSIISSFSFEEEVTVTKKITVD